MIYVNGIKQPNVKATSYYSWVNMRQRCLNKNSPIYKHYGGRGIKFCDSWAKFKNFYADMGEMPGPKYSLERIENDKDYSPTNCKWGTTSEQANNKRTSLLVTHNGETKTLMQWANFLGLKYITLYHRVREKNISFETAISMKNYTRIALFLIAISAASCSTRYHCKPDYASAEKAQVIRVIQRNINQTFKTAICWDNGGVYDTVTLPYFAKAGTCLTKCETSKP